MTLGVDHLQVGVADLEAADAKLRAWGYQLDFAQESANPGPEALPHYVQPDTPMRMLRRPGSAVELVRARAGSEPGPYALLGRTSGAGPDAGALGCEVHWSPADHEPTLVGVRLSVGDLAGAVQFWCGLGAQIVEERTERVELGFVGTMLSVPLRLVLERGPAPARTRYVDDSGCTLVALLSRSIERDLAKLDVQARVCELLVNKRRLRCAFFPGPAGALVELIEPVR